jgi:hypothetical protein
MSGLTSNSEIELSEEIDQTVDDKVTKKLISLLNTDLSTKLLDLLTQQNNLTTDESLGPLPESLYGCTLEHDGGKTVHTHAYT